MNLTFMNIKNVEQAINQSWDKDTCYPKCADKWTDQNPALGQCAVTALIVQDYLGGEILYCEHTNHYWNKLSDKTEVDLTKIQFAKGQKICQDEIKSRDDILNSQSAVDAKTSQRYKLLKQRVEQKLKK